MNEELKTAKKLQGFLNDFVDTLDIENKCMTDAEDLQDLFKKEIELLEKKRG